MSEWYYAQGDEQVGPLSVDDLKQRIQSGQLPPSTLVWEQSLKDWTPASRVALLAAPGAVVPPPLHGEADHAVILVTYAGFWKRFVAVAVDSIISGVVAAMLGFVVALVLLVGGSLNEEMAVGAQLVMNLFGVIVGWLYFAGFESSAYQATPGKMAIGIRVTDMDGNRISFLRATGRHFGKIVSMLTLMIGYIMAGFTERKQALHDIMAQCLVVNKD